MMKIVTIIAAMTISTMALADGGFPIIDKNGQPTAGAVLVVPGLVTTNGSTAGEYEREIQSSAAMMGIGKIADVEKLDTPRLDELELVKPDESAEHPIEK